MIIIYSRGVQLNKITTNFAYRLSPSFRSSFAKFPRSFNPDDVLFTPEDRMLGFKVIEDNLEG